MSYFLTLIIQIKNNLCWIIKILLTIRNYLKNLSNLYSNIGNFLDVVLLTKYPEICIIFLIDKSSYYCFLRSLTESLIGLTELLLQFVHLIQEGQGKHHIHGNPNLDVDEWHHLDHCLAINLNIELAVIDQSINIIGLVEIGSVVEYEIAENLKFTNAYLVCTFRHNLIKYSEWDF